MEYITYSHRHGEIILNEPEFIKEWDEVKEVLDNITEGDLIKQFPLSSNKMSLSAAINDLIKQRLVEKSWEKEVAIFSDPNFTTHDAKRWRLDFAKKDISVEVAFNHGEAIAWNLLKPAMASELNHVEKAIQTQVGIIILATDALKGPGAFDGAVGTYEKALRYMTPLNNFLTVPMVLIGLLAPKTFKIKKVKEDSGNVGEVVMF